MKSDEQGEFRLDEADDGLGEVRARQIKQPESGLVPEGIGEQFLVTGDEIPPHPYIDIEKEDLGDDEGAVDDWLWDNYRAEKLQKIGRLYEIVMSQLRRVPEGSHNLVVDVDFQLEKLPTCALLHPYTPHLEHLALWAVGENPGGHRVCLPASLETLSRYAKITDGCCRFNRIDAGDYVLILQSDDDGLYMTDIAAVKRIRVDGPTHVKLTHNADVAVRDYPFSGVGDRPGIAYHVM